MGEKNHVGRPTNDELKIRKRRKLFKYFVFFILVFGIITIGIKIVDISLLNASVKTKCPKGYVPCKTLKGKCKKTEPYSKASACEKGYILINGKCWKSYNTSCPAGYKKCESGANCNCKATIAEYKATSCESGYSVIDGKCYKTTSGESKCPQGYTESSDKSIGDCQKVTPQKYGSKEDCENGVQSSSEKTDTYYRNGICYRIKSYVTSCPSGYSACTNGTCQCRTYSSENKATACESGYSVADGKCYKTSTGSGKCPSGYNECKEKAKCDCKSKKASSKATACEEGFVLGNGKCWKVKDAITTTTTTKKKYTTGTLRYPLDKGVGTWSNGTKYTKDHLHYGDTGAWHGGNDISTNHKTGYNVYAMDGGEVIMADTTTNKCSGGSKNGCYNEHYKHYGKFVLLKHKCDNGRVYYTVYGHLSSVSIKVGKKVEKGDKIGKTGNTGHSTGPHLHIGMSYNTYSAKYGYIKGNPIYNKNVIAPYVYISGDKKGKSYCNAEGKTN